MIKNLPVMQDAQVQSLGWEDPLEKGIATPPLFLPGESRGQRSLMGYSPWGRRVRHSLVTNTFTFPPVTTEGTLYFFIALGVTNTYTF